MPTAKSPFVIVIGASAGGLNAIAELIAQFPADINAAIFVVLHLSKAAVGDLLVTRIQKNASLVCKMAEDKQSLQRGYVYVAPPDAHLLVKQDHMLIGHGPAENRFRPSIDVLFRSAAVSHRERVVGVILTGLLNDGTIGMTAIKQSGGHCVVQDPNEAEYPDMPLAVLESIEVDAVSSLKNMGAVIVKQMSEVKVNGIAPPDQVIAEAGLSEKVATSINEVRDLGQKSLYACPDCGGGLWEIENGSLKHYRCHIGHAYSESDLLIKQAESVEHTLWIAVRMMEERKLLLERIAKQNDQRGLQKLSTHYRSHARYLENHIAKLKDLLFAINKD